MTPSEQKAVLLEILKHLDAFCRDHGLTYFLYAGTLLGAVRHQGFIPWDDDIDVMMPRTDYQAFCDAFPTTGRYHLVSPETSRTHPYAYAKVCRTGTLVIEDVVMASEDTFGVNIDVIPFDPMSSRLWSFRLHARLAMIVRSVLLLKVVRPTHRLPRNVRWVLLAAQAVLRPVPTRVLTATRTRIARWRRRPTGYVGMLVASVPWRVPEGWVNPPRFQAFEGLSLPVPADAKALLQEVYGDFMTLPPENKRVPPHPSSAYWQGDVRE